ncbi:GTP diphosphokinase [Citrus sinensis]|uniref:GTP diphosphokinase n=1 Tax=Citrus sinensis TaxID=2711 RepID=A0ACB8MEA5_CITSI|nr:GTP diphosphokinase [Citrus sinensis]
MLGLAQKNSPFPIFFCKFRRNRPKFSCLLDHANVIAAAAAAGKAHGAVTSAITHVAVTAVAIASGACLSTKVQKAIAFAKRAHHGQFRKTGDPYLTHCIHTGRILAMLIPSSGKRAVDTVVAGILHDVVDDACESLGSIEEEFGDEVAKLVAGVSRLSYINQCCIMDGSDSGTGWRANDLRVMLLGMVDDPRVVLIKLADRLHNMRTIYALPPAKARAVAQETLLIWCSLASRLGLWALKAELEDLCFAVLQPQIFRKMRADLASMWSPRNRVGYSRRITTIVSSPPLDERTASDDESFTTFDEHVLSMKDLLEAVVPFDILSDRRKRTKFLHDLAKSSEAQKKAKVVQDAGIALTSLVACEEALEKELLISTSYIPGMEVTLSSRLKSLYSIFSKMRRKDVGIHKVYDARALRVVVGDKNGTLHGPAIQCCYSLLDIVHRLWIPIDGEFDDYIVNPKPSGYQSLHTAVQGPDGSALEVQIRTQKMHEYAEHGLAAHWLYKETGNKLQSISSMDESDIEASSSLSKDTDDHNPLDTDLFQKYSSLKMGHPVIRVEGSNLLAAVIIRVEKGGRELLVAVSFGLAASEVVADRRPSFQIKCWEAYARLYKKASDEWWCQPGHGDWCTCLEKYTLCRDGMYHKQDQFGRLLPTFIQITHLTEEEESEYWAVVSAVFEGKPVDSVVSRRSSDSVAPTSMEASINNKVRLLRTMLRWEEQLRSEASLRQSKLGGKANGNPDSVVPGEVVIVCWPNGEIMRLRSGSTAADAAMKVGLEGKLVLVNGQLVLPNTELKDGDIVEVRV